MLNRLRVGHCLFSHGYLMDNTVPDIAPICHFCNEGQCTVKHLLLRCPGLDQHRLRMRCFNSNVRPTLEKILGNSVQVHDLVNLLKDLNLYNQV